MRKNSNTRRRSSSNPGRFSQQEHERQSLRNDPRRPQNTKTKDSNFPLQDSMIPRSRIRSFSSDRLSGMRKSNLRTTTGAKTSIGQYTTASSAISPMPSNRYTHVIDSRMRSSHVDLAAKGFQTPMASGPRHIIPTSDGRTVRASSAERASVLAPKCSKKDTRPLTDKNYQNEMLSKIDNYFRSIGQSTILNNNGSLKPLTLKIFIEATSLLIKLLDMKQSLTAANYVEEIPKTAKKLHYPGLINKSWLKTANTMHSWPHAIGWICWLVELCEIKDLASEIFSLERLPIIGETEEEKENQRRNFLVMIKCYKAWNEEKPEDEEKIIQNFLEEEAERRGINPKKYDQIHSEFERAQKNLETEQEKTSKVDKELLQLQDKLMNLRKDQDKLKNHIIDQKKHIEKASKDTEQFNKESVLFTEDIKKLEIIKEQLSSEIKEQPMSVTERDEIVKACSEKQTYIQNFEAHLEEIKKEAYSLDIRLVSSNSILVKSILSYNQALFIQLSDCNIDIDQLLMPETGICEPDFMSVLESKKNLMNSFMQERYNDLHQKITLLESQSRELETMQTKKETLSNKVETKKALDEKLKNELKYKENQKREEIKRLCNAITKLNESVVEKSNELDMINQQLTESTDKREAVLRKNVHLHESAKIFFMEMYSILDEHRGKIKKSLEMYLKANA